MTEAFEMHLARRGSADGLQPRQVQLAEPGAGQVRVRVEAAGVAYADILIRNGLYPGHVPPVTPGYDLVGIVEAVGHGVDGLRVGQRVAGITVAGSYATHCNVEADVLVPAPVDADAGALVAAVLNGVTAWQMLHRLSAAMKGDWVLVHGAAGGVGSLLVDFAGLAGIRAVGTASAGKLGAVAAREATPLDYGLGNVAAKARKLAGGGFVAAFDHIGGGHFRKVSLAALAPGGVGVTYGGYETTRDGRIRPMAVAEFLLNSRFSARKLFGQSQGVATYSAPVWRDHRRLAYRQDLSAVLELVASGAVAPLIGRRFPLSEAAEAQRCLERRVVSGKIVLVP